MRWWRDVRYGLRSMKRAPGLTAIVVLCIGLAIGLNGTIFSIVDALLLRTLPVKQPEQLVRVYQAHSGFPWASFSFLNYLDVRDRASDVFSGFVTAALRPVDARTSSGTRRLAVEIVSGNYFEVLGVGAQRGRVLRQDDDLEPGAHPVVVLGANYWRTQYAGREDIVGDTLTLNGQPFTIVGVAQEGFRGGISLAEVQVWVPLAMEPVIQPSAKALERRGSGWLFMTTGRLRAGTTIEQAKSRLTLIAAQMTEENGWEKDSFDFTVVPLSHATLGAPQARGPALGSSALLLVAVLLVLLVACANIANLLLARAEARRREMAIRSATGAGRWQLVRQLLTETLLMTTAGGVAGWFFAFAAGRLIPRWIPDLGLPLYLDFSPNTRVAVLSIALVVITALLVGLAPALRALRGNTVAQLRGESTATPGRRRWGAGSPLVISQVALSVLLLVGAALFVRALTAATRIDPGFRPVGVLVAEIDPSFQGLDQEQVQKFHQDLQSLLSTLPGVESVALGETVPFSPANSQQTSVEIEGYESAPGERMNPDYNVVTASYFSTIGLRLASGRAFLETDVQDSPPVVVINETMARRYWKDGDALGRRMQVGRSWREVVGITADHKWKGLGQKPEPYFFLPDRQVYEPALGVHLRVLGDPNALRAPLEAAVKSLLPGAAVVNIRTLDEQMQTALFPVRASATVLALLGGLALLLAAIGLYGVLGYTVSRRTREIGIRLALGAEQKSILSSTMKQGLAMVGAGLVLGLVLAGVASRLLAGMLYGVPGLDPAAFLAASALLLGVAVAACLGPALRAIRIDPWKTLRSE